MTGKEEQLIRDAYKKLFEEQLQEGLNAGYDSEDVAGHVIDQISCLGNNGLMRVL